MLMLIITLVIATLTITYISRAINWIEAVLIRLDKNRLCVEFQLCLKYHILMECLYEMRKYVNDDNGLLNRLVDVKDIASVEELNTYIRNQNECESELLALGNSHSEISMSDMFSTFKDRLIEENTRLASSKRTYNRIVKYCNDTTASFPKNLICSVLNIERQGYITE